LEGFLMLCSTPHCGKPAISLGLCTEHFPSPGATIEALAEKYVAAADPLPGQWPGLHYSMGRSLRKGGIAEYLIRWLLDHGTLPEGVHSVPWNTGGRDRMEVDFSRLQSDPGYPLGRSHPEYGKPPVA
jgi:hypothetical protein